MMVSQTLIHDPSQAVNKRGIQSGEPSDGPSVPSLMAIQHDERSMRNASAWWIRASDGAMERVTKHDLWLKNPENLKKWNLEALIPHLDKLSDNEEDAIRMLGIQAGLIRVRATKGSYSIQFSADKSEVRCYLEVVHKSLKPLAGYLSSVRIGNLHPSANETQIMRWDEFESKMDSGEEIMTTEGIEGIERIDLVAAAPTKMDIPNDPKLFDRVAALLKKDKNEVEGR